MTGEQISVPTTPRNNEDGSAAEEHLKVQYYTYKKNPFLCYASCQASPYLCHLLICYIILERLNVG